MAFLKKPENEAIIHYLIQLKEAELLALLMHVFHLRGNQTINENWRHNWMIVKHYDELRKGSTTYFVPESLDGDYPGPALGLPASGNYDEDGFYQSGGCPECGLWVACTEKLAICPYCGSQVPCT